jgi:hypothetical protein
VRFGFSFTQMKGKSPRIFMCKPTVVAKFWLQPVSLASSMGFSAKELNQLLGLVREHEVLFMEAWNDFFNIKR